LLVAGAYATARAIETASSRWLVLAATLVGVGFLTKMLQALLVVPAFALAYLLAAPTTLRRRMVALCLAGAGLLVFAGWWVAVVELVPAQYRPYIGGSQTDSVLELTLGYNGLGRLTGEETGSVGGGMGWGQTGWSRLFGSDIGGQVAWLLPAALILLAAGLWATRRAPRTDRTRAAYLLWGGWLLVTGLVFSFMAGIFHAYYTVALAPAIAALVGMGAHDLWRRRNQLWARATLSATVGVTAIWSYVLLGRSPDWQPWLRGLVLAAGAGAALALLAVPRATRRVAMPVAAVALVAVLAGPTAYAVQTAATPHSGAIPAAGPAVSAGSGQPPPGLAGGQLPGGAGTARPGGAAGLLDASNPSAELVALLERDSDSYTWVAAAAGSNNASGYQLATGDPVMAIGGFNGSDPSPTLQEFQQHVADGRIHYFIGGGSMRANGGGSAAQQIAGWVAANFTPTTEDGKTVYDLTSATAATTT